MKKIALLLSLVLCLSSSLLAQKDDKTKKTADKEKVDSTSGLTMDSGFISINDINALFIALYKELNAENFDKAKAIRDQWLNALLERLKNPPQPKKP